LPAAAKIGAPIESAPIPVCKACGEERPAWSTLGRCPSCGLPDVPPAPVKTEAELKADAITEKFRLAARRAKGDF
jgi:hypothetical protein